MDKIWLIIKREYSSRVLKKSFLLITILTPLSFVLIALVSGYLASRETTKMKIAISDSSGIIKQDQLSSKDNVYTVTSTPFDSIKVNYIEQGYDAVVRVPALDSLNQRKMGVSYISEEKLSISALGNIEDDIQDLLEKYKINNSTFSQQDIDNLKISVEVENALSSKSEENANVKGDTSTKMSSIIASGLSYMMGFMMYMVIFIFGGMVMRSVMEEKINRVVEVMVSSVKPFQLLLGKIFGVGLVGLTQLLIWMILIPVGIMVATKVMGIDMPNPGAEAINSPEMQQIVSESSGKIGEVLMEIKNLNWWLIIPSFIVFFFGGYFLYSALFAAVGASIGDDLTEGQSMMFPIIVPVIIAFVMLSSVLRDPNGSMAIFGSMFPLFSPILMPARLPFDPPVWQVLLSMVFLVAGIVLVTWLAARIYRIGIFRYGKKASFKDLGKWLFQKD